MITIENKNYELIKDEKSGFDYEAFKERYTEYFEDYDYVVGDWAYGKLRLKGFSEKDNPNHNDINDVSQIETYINEYCAYGCKYFILKKNKVE